MELLIDFHRQATRLGPGSEADTLRAHGFTNLAGKSSLQVADIGCGTGASSLLLAQHLDAQITAVDLFAEFLDRNQNSMAAQNLVDSEKEEIRLYQQYGEYYSYGFYIAQKI
ncbi:MAG: class I SAM-dependent methyltransferase [Leptospiraceae bacterium]|nr:class I SAM-dependent methyltransferase [Leptospiraceae bacterium]